LEDLMRYLVGFGRFWYEFIVGDDWRIAAGVTLVLALGAVAVAAGLGGEWLPPTLAAGFAVVFAAPLIVGTRPSATGGAPVPATSNRPHQADQESLV
jgi:hypothetical protein